MKVEIWSDIMCPFCYIGKRNFEMALQHFEHKNDIEVEWKSFQLDPSIPEEVKVRTDIYTFFANKKGMSVEEARNMHQNVIDYAQNSGLQFNFDILMVANSIKAHRIIQLATTKGLANDVEEIFFQSYFVDGKDLGNIETLVELGSSVGLEKSEIENALADDSYLKAAVDDIGEAANLGIDSVPYFVFNRKYAVQGAQPAHHMLEALKQAYQDFKNNSEKPLQNLGSGESCSVDGDNC